MGCARDVVLSHFLAITARAQLESKDVDLPINVARGRNAFHRFPSQAVPNKLFSTGPPIGLDVSERFLTVRVTKLMAQLRMRGPHHSRVKTLTLKTISKMSPSSKYSAAGEDWGRVSQHIKKGTNTHLHVSPFVHRRRPARVIRLVGPQSETMTAVNFADTLPRNNSDESMRAPVGWRLLE